MPVYWSFVLYMALHAAVNGVAMYFIISYLERGRSTGSKALMACATVAPALLLGGFVLSFSSALNFQNLSYVRLFIPIAVFLVLWQAFRLPPRRAGLLAVIYFVVTLVTPLVLTLVLPLFRPFFRHGGAAQLGPSLFLLTIIVIPVAIWIAARSFGEPKRATVITCYGLAAVIAPSLVVGHGYAILPAIFVWPLVLEGGATGMIFFIMTSVSVLITGTIFLGIAKFMQRQRSDVPNEIDDRHQ